MLTGIGHVAYYVTDMEKAKDFYCNKLGLKHIFDIPDDEGNPWIVYLQVVPGQFVELFYNGQSIEKPWNAACCSHLCLTTDDVEGDIAVLQAKGVEIDTMPNRGKDRNIQAWIHDPDGNPIELMTICPESAQAKSLEG